MVEMIQEEVRAASQFYARHWWVLLLRGVVGILAGLIALVWPGIALLALAILVGIFFLWSGGWEVYLAFRFRRLQHPPV
jgi:uncharacterized membrane protein HdeD (DUF308 family)